MVDVRHTQIHLFFLWISFFGQAQQVEELIQQRIEFIASQRESEEVDLSNFFDVLTEYHTHPLNLNSASDEELRSLALLNELQIQDFLFHRLSYGKLISIYELQSLLYWDLITIQRILPFVKVDDRLDQTLWSWKSAWKYGKIEVITRAKQGLEPKKGYIPLTNGVEQVASKYAGGPLQLFSRLRYTYRSNLTIGLLAEKDPGESFYQGGKLLGFDFYSAHAFYKGGKYIRKVAIGDYQAQFGQGLNTWLGYSMAKSTDITAVKKNAVGIRPFVSADETQFLRGGAVELGINKFSFTPYFSFKKVDGAISPSSDSLINDEFSSISLTGLHRTDSEIINKNVLREMIVGGNINYNGQRFHLGCTGTLQSYSASYQKPVYPYNRFDFRGKQLTNISADYSYVLRNVNLFGELSISSFGNAVAQLYGLVAALDTRNYMSIVYRNYDKDYHTFYNSGFSDGSKTQNEKGVYLSWKTVLTKSMDLSSYIDLFKFPWLKYRIDAPSEGREFVCQWNYKPSKTVEFYLRLRQQDSPQNSREENKVITKTENIQTRNLRLHCSFQPSKHLRLRSRVEASEVKRLSAKTEYGTLLYQDCTFRFLNLPLDCTFRLAIFSTDSFDSRIYAYESNPLSVFSIPAYYYKGSKWYVMLHYTLRNSLDLWVRIAKTNYMNRTSVGSSWEEIEGNSKSEILLQLRYKW